jgi:hypothetical protein
MDDYNSNLLNDSKSEWSIRLMNILSGHIIDGFRSIFREAMEVCEKNDEAEKYLMTFQNYLSVIPKWNQNMVEAEVERIKESSQCKYLEDLITCVHILQLKILSCVRTGNHNKKIDIDIPCFKTFLHNVYINIARKLYSNIYLFQIDATPLQQQKHNREFEIIVQTCIMNTIRDNIPVEQLLKQYIDETQEVDVEKTEKIVEEKKIEPEATSKPETTLETQTESQDNVITLDGEADIPVPSEAVAPVAPSDEEPPTVHDLLPNVKSEVAEQESKSISFEDDAQQNSIQENNEISESVGALTIGDNVPLIVDGNFDEPVSSHMNEIEEINLDFDKIEDETRITGSEPPIDLGIEELAI